MHSGGYFESHDTEERIIPTMDAVKDYLIRHGWPEAATSPITVSLCHAEFKHGWNRHYIVKVHGVGNAAFTDEALKG